MSYQQIESVLIELQEGKISLEKALLALKKKPFEDIGFAKIDHHRKLRQGYPEVIYGAGKTAEQIIEIIKVMKNNEEKTILITRIDKKVAETIDKRHPLNYDDMSRIGIIGKYQPIKGCGNIVVVSGGTSDMPVAEEAAITAEAFGNHVIRLYDVGVAGLHRLLAHLDEIMSANVVIAVAGMEGAIASVVGGLVDCPVIAVPTSVGYGASFNGLAALLSMLNSCSSGVSVVNIDNGFGAGYNASMINRKKISNI